MISMLQQYLYRALVVVSIFSIVGTTILAVPQAVVAIDTTSSVFTDSTIDFGSGIDFTPTIPTNTSSSNEDNNTQSDTTQSDSTSVTTTGPASGSASTGGSISQSCKLYANLYTVDFGSDVTIFWESEGYTTGTLTDGSATINLSGNKIAGGSETFKNIQVNTTYTLHLTADQGSDCNFNITVTCLPEPTPVTCEDNLQYFTATPNPIPNGGGTTELSWKTTDVASLSINNGISSTALTDTETITLANDTTFTMTIVGDDGSTDHCPLHVTVDPIVVDPLPKCNDFSFTTTPSPLPYTGGDVTLSWNTSNADSVLISGGSFTNQSVTPLAAGTITDTITDSTTYNLTVAQSDGDTDTSCSVHVPVPDAPIVSCEANVTKFVAEPNTLPFGGGNTTLIWETTGLQSLSITDVTSTALSGNETVTVSTDKEFVLTAVGPVNTVYCPLTVDVLPPAVQPATLIADKIVCTEESQLPNWGPGGDDITAQTAAQWVASNDSCEFAADWKFQWGPGSVTNPGDALIGEAGDPWTTFGPTNASGRAQTTVNVESLNIIWVREVLKNGYIPFTYNLNGQQNTDDVTAEIYCHTDTLNYDNFDNINSPIGGKTYYCVAWNVAEPTPDPVTCAANVTTFTANPTNLGVGGGETTLAWETTGLQSLAINNGITSTNLTDSEAITITDDTTFTMTITGPDGSTDQCPVTVAVEDPQGPDPLSCSDIVFTASDTSVARFSNVTLNWNVPSDVDSVSIDNNIGAVANVASESVTIDDDSTYTLTAVRGSEDPVSCPVTITTTTGGGGGGGGGSASPRCELSVSDSEIAAGEEVTLSWETSNVRELILTDDDGEIVFTTDEYLNRDKEPFFDHEITVTPERDTTYTLLVENGRRDQECTVDVEVGEDNVVVFSDRGQVAGIALSQVPYTGFEAGTMMTILFYGLLALWALYLAYVLTIKRDRILGFALPGTLPQATHTSDYATEAVDTDSTESVAAAYVASAAPVVSAPRATVTDVPSNLPTGMPAPVIGYANYQTQTESETPVTTTITPVPSAPEAVVKQVEDRAHQQHVLLSSDAISHFVEQSTQTDRMAYLDMLLHEARVSFPSEDGWVVLNRERMTHLCGRIAAPVASVETAQLQSETNFEAPLGTGSLAEAIVTGNISAAYQLISARPMIALADAAADLDAAYRVKRGEEATVSELLEAHAAKLTESQLQNAIVALTSALDGTYSSEADAVKMAVMKAIKEVV